MGQATELVIQIAADRAIGSSSSSTFHELALLRCDALRPTGGGAAVAAARAVGLETPPPSAEALTAPPSVASVRRLYYEGLVHSAHRRAHRGAPGTGATSWSEGGDDYEAAVAPFAGGISLSYSSLAKLRCRVAHGRMHISVFRTCTPIPSE